MTVKIKNYVVTWALAVFLILFFAWNVFGADKQTSESERRSLASFPKLTWETVTNGKFMGEFEDYSMDQFPMRDTFRTIKALSLRYVFFQKDMNNIYLADGYLSKYEAALDESSIENAVSKFNRIYDLYLAERESEGNGVYYTIVPDKNYFLASRNGYPAIDYDALVSIMNDGLTNMQYIDIFDKLDIGDYYYSDTHWRQEKIVDVAGHIAETMTGMAPVLLQDYTVNELDNPFYGVYYGQAALPIGSEKLYYLTNDVTDTVSVFDYETGETIGMYDMDKAYSRDPYEMYLSGSKSLLKITNQKSSNGKRLVVLRDSFGSSIVPLLAQYYDEITVVDIRYMMSAQVGRYVDFEGCDVLFLYSTLVLNNSITLK